MSEEKKEGQDAQKDVRSPVEKVIDEKDEKKNPPKVWTRKDAVKFVTVPLHLPKLYPDFDPWVFKMRLKLSSEAEERRQTYLALSASERTSRIDEQMLDEVCDLLVSMPTGFGDLQDTSNGPGHSFKSYVETSAPDEKILLSKIVEGVSNHYWAFLMPREFRPAVSDSLS